jgi:hypothetical protein
MPRLILMSAFGEAELAENMVYFLDHLEQAEHTIPEKDLRLLENITVKDRGPILFWLINERGRGEHALAPYTIPYYVRYSQGNESRATMPPPPRSERCFF